MHSRRLSDVLGTTVVGPGGEHIGRLGDLAASLAEVNPVVTHLVVRGRWHPWSAVDAFDSEIRLRDTTGVEQPERALLLGRHVLDSQVVDLDGKRLRRVGDVELVEDDGKLRLAAVDVGTGSVIRRLGFHSALRLRTQTVDWQRLHVVARPAHALQLAAPAAAVHRLDDDELATLVEQLPPTQGEEVIARFRRPLRARRRRARRRFPFRLIRRHAAP